MTPLARRVAATLRRLVPGGGRALVAVSGGPDSLALLALLVEGREDHGLALVVGHVDHGIDPESGAVATRVQAAAARFGLEARVATLALGAGTTETRAREGRRRALERLRRTSGAAVIVLGHHADDQAETVLCRALHGSAPAGLAAMQPRAGRWVRPLLELPRAELASVAAALDPWHDPANHDPVHFRSWVRYAVLPGLRARLPDVDRRLVAVARHAATDREAWDALLDAWPGLDVRAVGRTATLAAGVVAALPDALALAVVRAVARRVGVVLGPVRAARVVATVRAGGGRTDLGGEALAEVSVGRLVVAPAAPSPAAPQPLQGGAGAIRGEGWRLVWRAGAAPHGGWPRRGLETWVPVGPWAVRPWKAGERMTPVGARGSAQVSDLFQAARIPRLLRVAWPVVARGDEVVWIPGVCRAAAHRPAPGEAALLLWTEVA